MRGAAALLLCLLAWQPVVVHAETAQPTVTDPVTNKRAVHLAEQLRCLVCQNQTIADSNADLAVDLRRQIREQIAQGKNDGEIVDFMVERYGDFVRYRPPLKATTLLLWFGPPLLLMLGMVWFVSYLRARLNRVAQQPLSPAEHRAAEALLSGSNEGANR